MSIAAEDLVGGWDLLDWRIETTAQITPSHPFGADAQGQIMYTADGRMSAVIARAGRVPLSTPSPRQASAEECREAFTSFFCYAGTWHLEGDTVVHRLRLALNPAMLGTEQRRKARLAGDRLELSASESLGGGRERRHRITWQRARH
ncbi:MAG: lipocalin-like domain-containing protein [Gammaproteobacteria bacterium]|nr:lipocalin-like domain-containing protein [Gammaproteobacteria bacterium]